MKQVWSVWSEKLNQRIEEDCKAVKVLSSLQPLCLKRSLNRHDKINWTKIKGSCQSGRKVAPLDSSCYSLMLFLFWDFSNSVEKYLHTQSAILY